MIHRRSLIGIYLMVLIALIDQLTKWWVVESVMKPPRVVEETSFLNLVLVMNKGVTFGLFSRIDHRFFPFVLIGVAALVLFLLGRWLWRTSSIVVALALGMIMGGAIGNVIDRVRFGAVVDFLDFYYRDYHWYAFNIGDAAIVTGVGLLLLDSLVRAR
jgi:signal peptidase II